MFYLYQDESLRSQHEAVRKTAGWFDFTHRVMEVTGPDSPAFLDYMYLAPLAGLGVGCAKYTCMLDEDGLICDDVIIFRLEEDKFWVSSLYTKDMQKRYDAYSADYDVAYEVVTEQWRMYSVQGPKSAELVNRVIDVPVNDLRFFKIRDTNMGDVPMKVAHSGFTGEESGYELYVPFEHRDELEAKLQKAADTVGGIHVTEVDAMVMTLPAEAGLYLMLDLRRCTPYEVGFDRMVDFSKDFVGKRALKRASKKEPARKLVGIEVPDREAVIYGGPHGASVERDGMVVGRVTKFTYGFSIEKNIGYALVDADCADLGTKISCNGYEMIVCPTRHLA